MLRCTNDDCSLFGEPSKIDSVLAAMAIEQRKLTPEMLKTDHTGRSLITRWLDEIEIGAQVLNFFEIDGVALDSASLCAINVDGDELAPTKMSVRELRAELAARQYPLRGNKRELVKQLQKARSAADIEGSSASAKSSKSKKVCSIHRSFLRETTSQI